MRELRSKAADRIGKKLCIRHSDDAKIPSENLRQFLHSYDSLFIQLSPYRDLSPAKLSSSYRTIVKCTFECLVDSSPARRTCCHSRTYNCVLIMSEVQINKLNISSDKFEGL